MFDVSCIIAKHSWPGENEALTVMREFLTDHGIEVEISPTHNRGSFYYAPTGHVFINIRDIVYRRIGIIHLIQSIYRTNSNMPLLHYVTICFLHEVGHHEMAEFGGWKSVEAANLLQEALNNGTLNARQTMEQYAAFLDEQHANSWLVKFVEENLDAVRALDDKISELLGQDD